MKNLNFLIKPASSLCNMRCRYCFYEDVSAHRAVKSYGFMSRETAEALIRSAFRGAGFGGTVTFAFQGGEPTMAGLPFYEAFAALEKKHSAPGVAVRHAIQTNGQVIDPAWARFFKEHHFLVGLSMDGTRDLHDLYRIDGRQRGTWKTTASALSLLQAHSVEVNLLCVVTKQTARRALKVYHSLKKLGVRYLQFIPCLDPIGGARGAEPYSLDPISYGHFLCSLFDAWYADWKAGQYVSIRLFDDYIHSMTGHPVGSCAASGRCGGCLVVESDGGLYPCDFYVLDRWRLGSILDESPLDAFSGELAQKFVSEGAIRPADCGSCPWSAICRGGCKRDWRTVDGRCVNYYCPSFQQLFSYAFPRLQEIARAELRAANLAGPYVSPPQPLHTSTQDV